MASLRNFDFGLDFFLVSPSEEEELEELELKWLVRVIGCQMMP